MLYVTTRIGDDVFTASRALAENRGPDGGFYVPMRLPRLDHSQIAELKEKTFSQVVAEIMNLFFGTKIDGQSIELAVGRYPVKLCPLNGKIVAVKAWNNPVYRFNRFVSGVEKVIRQSEQSSERAADWVQIAVRISMLFGVYCHLMQGRLISEGQEIDISVPSGDMSQLMAAWYARSMGLPIGTIVCCCNENHTLWNLLHKGELRTDTIAEQTHTPDCDYTVAPDLERLIFAVSDHKEVSRFCEAYRTGSIYELGPELTERLRAGMHVSVVSVKRMASTIPNLYKTTEFLADPYTALSYSGLIDYRAAIGSNKPAVIISEESPLFSLEFVAQCMNMLPAELKRILD